VLPCLALLLPLLAACNGSNSTGQVIAWREEPLPSVAAPPTPTPTPASAAGGANTIPVVLGADDLARIRPNELGRIPVLMYHGFTHNEAYLDEWTLTYATFQAQLQWLYEHDFYVTPLADLITNEISVPPGKRPVVLTFDDASPGQFRLLRDTTGTLAPDPESAVGVMEAFFAAHPDFGRGGLFAVVARNCFTYEEEQATCEERLAWLDDHGYEIANHTWWHENLHTVSDEMLKEQVGRTKIFIDERVRGDGNLSNVLVLPFGEWPRGPGQADLLYDGFIYDGQEIVLAGIVEVHGGPVPSPSSGEWTRWSIGRFNTDPEQWAYWTGLIDSGELTLFTSDGNSATVAIPNQLPDDLVSHWDPEWASAYGMQVIRYDLPGDAGAVARTAVLPPASRPRVTT
jgi:peptidoglycan/xylan/chitin deacetylase (PgdA/CDA1 family)